MLSTTSKPTLKEGLFVRAATMDDVEAAVDLFNTCSMAMIGAPDLTVQDVHLEWQLPDFNLETDTRVVIALGDDQDEQIVGYVEVWTIAKPPVYPWVWARVHPTFEGQGIGTYLMTWAEERARQAIAKTPPEARVAMRSGTISTHKPAKRLLEDLGMQAIRHHWRMVIELNEQPPAPEWPEGFTLRTLIPGQDERAVLQAVRDSFQDHWGYMEQPFEEEFQRWMHFISQHKDYDPSLWFLALAGDDIAGVSLCSPKIPEDLGMGWVDTLGVRRPWRRKGLGLALLRHSFGEFYRRGQRRVGLDVDADSLTGATRLYEKAGMYVARRFITYEKELRPGKDLSRQSIEE